MVRVLSGDFKAQGSRLKGTKMEDLRTSCGLPRFTRCANPAKQLMEAFLLFSELTPSGVVYAPLSPRGLVARDDSQEIPDDGPSGNNASIAED